MKTATTTIDRKTLRTATWTKLSRIYHAKGTTARTRKRIVAEVKRCGYEPEMLFAFHR